MTELTLLSWFQDLHKICKLLSMLKLLLIERLTHYGHDALFLKNDDITTGLLNNITEIKIHLLAGHFLYFHNQERRFIDLINDDIAKWLESIVTNYEIDIPQISNMRNLSVGDLSYYRSFVTKTNRSLELFRMKLAGHFTQIHLCQDRFDFSVEWFYRKKW